MLLRFIEFFKAECRFINITLPHLHKLLGVLQEKKIYIIGLMPVAVFPSLPISGFSRFCRPAVLLFLFCCVTSLHAFYYLLPNPFSLFLFLSFYFDNVLGCNSALFFWKGGGIFMLVFITVLYGPSEWCCFFPHYCVNVILYPLPFPLKRKISLLQGYACK